MPSSTPVLPPIALLYSDEDSRPETPVASRPAPKLDTSSNLSPSSSSAQSPTSSTNSSQSSFMLPIPAPSSNGSQASFTYVEASDGIGPLPPEIAAADISIAPDGSFVETSSGPAAIELKRRYDQHFGVNKDVRSPYAITAFVNQHGRRMFRVGHRAQSAAPAASGVDAESSTLSRKSLNSVSPPARYKRRSRMSVHAFPNLFRNGSSSTNTQTRKLRKTRSIPDMANLSPAPMTRTHSYSVTSIDAPRLPELDTTLSNANPSTDLFGKVMDWPSYNSPNHSTQSLSLPRDSSSSSNASFSDHESPDIPTIIPRPFGRGVLFNSPRRPGIEHLRQPRHLREMQSFESGLTARQSEAPAKFIEPLSPIPSELFGDDDGELDRPPSAIRIRSPVPEEEKPETWSVSPETAVFSHFTVDMFDIIQTYRGVPTIDKLLSDSEDTDVIRLTFNSENASAPRNDPRFVLWGEVTMEGDDMSISQESFSSGTRSSSLSKRKGKAKNPEVPNLRLTSGDGVQKVIIAASIERWIAQLTSELNYDELLNFFLTYRAYIGAMDLCHILICRFHWALQKTSSSSDETVRRIVRLRTFVAFRYWLLTFFTVDFLPNRELRLLFANWINTLLRDPILAKHSDGLSIVKKLKKVAQDCQKVHTRAPPPPKSRPASISSPAGKTGSHILGAKFAEATKKHVSDEEEDDLDLDFVLGVENTSNGSIPLSNIHLGGGVLLPTGGTHAIPSSSLSILQRTDHAPGPGSNSDLIAPFIQTSATLPIHHNALSRAFVKTVGRLGRWKRVLNNRNAPHRLGPSSATCTDVSAFDLELSMSRDLLTVHGGVEQYLKLIDAQPESPSSTPTPQPPPTAAAAETPAPSGVRARSSSIHISAIPPQTSTQEVPPLPVERASTEYDNASQRDSLLSIPTTESSSSHPEADRVSIARTSSTDSFGEELSSDRASARFAGFKSPWQFDVVSIDDLDLSDSSSSEEVAGAGPSHPPGLRRLAKKLPLRRDFEFVRRSDTVSSMDLTNRASVASEADSATSEASVVLGGPIQQWQINALVESLSDDEERGDVDDALKRLEGQINSDRQREKASKVDGWVRTMQERLVTGDYEDEPPPMDEDEYEDEDEEDDGQDASDEDDVEERPSPSASVEIFRDSLSASDGQTGELATTPVATQSPYLQNDKSPKAKPAPEDAVPMEILQSRMPIEGPSITVPRGTMTAPSKAPVLSPSKMPDAPRMHQSFILAYPSETFAQIFTMIDKDLFTSVKFEELILDDWMGEDGLVDITDWVQYLKDRSRWTAEKRFPAKTSALAALRARFNLMASFTVSEIVLTHPGARHVLVGKFIRIAWKCWQMSNFNTLVAIISALDGPLVTKAMHRLWSRLSLYETRLLHDLRIFTSKDDCFKFIRTAVDNIVDAKPLEAASHTPSVVSGGPPVPSSVGHASTAATTGKSKSVDLTASTTLAAPNPTCIPFIGVYLSQLQDYSLLPDLIDPTSPNTPVSVDVKSMNFESLSHPEVFDTLQPLPPGIGIEPLINVHKQRMRASVIKRLVAGQHVASRVHWPCDRKLLQKCLRMRALTHDMRQRALGMYELTSPAANTPSKVADNNKVGPEWFAIHV